MTLINVRVRRLMSELRFWGIFSCVFLKHAKSAGVSQVFVRLNDTRRMIKRALMVTAAPQSVHTD